MAEESKSSSKKEDARVSGVSFERDPKKRAESLGLNPKGISTEPYDVSEAQAAEDAVQEKGFLGVVPDPTPNENYEASNSAKENDLPTPETDRDLYDEARNASLGHPRDAVERNSAEIAAGAKPRAGDK